MYCGEPEAHYSLSAEHIDYMLSVLLLLYNTVLFCCVHFQWQNEDVLGPSNQPLSVGIPPRSVILSNMKKKLYKLSQDEGAIVAIQVSSHGTHSSGCDHVFYLFCSIKLNGTQIGDELMFKIRVCKITFHFAHTHCIVLILLVKCADLHVTKY